PLTLDETRVWIIDLDAGLSPGESAESAEPGPERELLCEEERTRAARFVRPRDRRRFVRCRAALREILGGLLAESAAVLSFRAVGQGKPELAQSSESTDSENDRLTLRFNVSHSAELALIAVCRGRELGIDLERVRPISEAARIVDSFFTIAEQSAFAMIGREDQSLAFHRGWTRKEAILKALGVGISGLAARHETGFGTTPLISHFTPATPSGRVGEWILWEAAPRAGFVAALAVWARCSTDPSADAERAGASTSLPASPGSP